MDLLITSNKIISINQNIFFDLLSNSKSCLSQFALLKEMHATAQTLARSVWKGPFYVHFPNLQQCIKSGTPVKTQARASTIMPHMIGAKFLVHNGKDYVPVRVTEEMVGRKLGEFSHTRQRFTYRLTKNK